MTRTTIPAPRRSRPPRSRSPAPTARRAAYGWPAPPRPAGPGPRSAAGPGRARPAPPGGPRGLPRPARQALPWSSRLLSGPRAGHHPPTRLAAVGGAPPVEHLDLPVHPGGNGLVVGDHHDRGPGLVELFEQAEDGGPGGLGQVPGGLISQADRRGADQRP